MTLMEVALYRLETKNKTCYKLQATFEKK